MIYLASIMDLLASNFLNETPVIWIMEMWFFCLKIILWITYMKTAKFVLVMVWQIFSFRVSLRVYWKLWFGNFGQWTFENSVGREVYRLLRDFDGALIVFKSSTRWFVRFSVNKNNPAKILNLTSNSMTIQPKYLFSEKPI